MGISKANYKEEESNPRSGNCTGVKNVYVYVDNGVYVHMYTSWYLIYVHLLFVVSQQPLVPQKLHK